MDANKLTAAAVVKLKPGKKRREVPDGGAPGLRLVSQPSGHKSWAMRTDDAFGTHPRVK
jgi:hypothetical protein